MSNHGLYIHVPFCVSKCPYCDFYSVANVNDELSLRYFSALLEELSAYKDRTFDTIYIGGGTPSAVNPQILTAFIAAMLRLIDYRGREFTIEVNPESVTSALCAGLAPLPVSRISMGVQSLSDEVLSLLGRAHNAERARSAYGLLRESLMPIEINLDVIYDIPQVEPRLILESVQDICRMAPDHISAYAYTDATGWKSADNNDDPSQMLAVVQILADYGYPRYEVSNFARLGREALHNSRYWQGGPYIGLGAGAHSMEELGGRRYRWEHAANIDAYIANPLAKDNMEELSPDEAAREDAVFGLRLSSGINIVEISRKCSNIADELMQKLSTLEGDGLVTKSGDRWSLTEKGFLLLDSVMAYLW